MTIRCETLTCSLQWSRSMNISCLQTLSISKLTQTQFPGIPVLHEIVWSSMHLSRYSSVDITFKKDTSKKIAQITTIWKLIKTSTIRFWYITHIDYKTLCVHQSWHIGKTKSTAHSVLYSFPMSSSMIGPCTHLPKTVVENELPKEV